MLLAIGGCCGALLVGTHALTEERIASNRAARARMLLAELAGAALPANLNIDQQIFGACERAVFQRVIVNGYAGKIHLTSMWRAADTTLAMRVTQHRETPGIGDFVDHQRDSWLPAQDRSSAEQFAAVDNVSGATITTKAIRRAAVRSFDKVEAYCGG